MPKIAIRGARENNLQDLHLEIPHQQLVLVTGVSGSGKSSLAFDVLAREGQRRYLETLSGFSRQYLSKLSRPQVDEIEGLSPVITVSQKTTSNQPRSTVGTISNIYGVLRLLFARLGEADPKVELSRSLFSFNSTLGACPTCNGLGLEEQISLNKLVADPQKTLREGALAPTLPNGYIMYSQVTVDVLNTVCEAHGFNVDIPWNELTLEQQDVVLNGSTRLKVPFGKHSLESRLKWTGITAKPREEGFYKGLLPIMRDILRRDRNKNILRYVESIRCTSCGGSRLNEQARSVKVRGKSIDQLTSLEIRELLPWLQQQDWNSREQLVANPLIAQLEKQISLLENLGVGYLSCGRSAASLSGGELQRIRLVNQVTAGLSNVLFVFDEPSIGLHANDNQHLLDLLRQLVNQGNTVVVVEHDETTIRQADWVVDIGPKAGVQGGQLLYNGPAADFLAKQDSVTQQMLHAADRVGFKSEVRPGRHILSLTGCTANNLQGIDAAFQLGSFNVVTGVSGAGKSSLVHGCLQAAVEQYLANEKGPETVDEVAGLEQVDQLVVISQKPIGRTPRSNPATYAGLADKLRDLYAKTPEAKAAGYPKGRFSFNNKGGRCETCQGAGRIQVGMHVLGQVDVICPTCGGKRFNDETLQVRYRGKNIAEALELTVTEALSFFQEEPTILRYLEALDAVGLGYVTLGQSSTTLSGGEAQRIKLATHLQQRVSGHTLYVLDEPTVGLHMADVKTLLHALNLLVDAGHTVVCIEHDADVIRQADWMIDLGPASGTAGGQLLAQGTPETVWKNPTSVTAQAIQNPLPVSPSSEKTAAVRAIELKGVRTNTLKGIDVHIPRDQLTVFTGVSGSGKSSLAFDTLFAEAQSRFSESFPTYVRNLMQQANPADLERANGLGPVVGIGRQRNASKRSTVATLTGLNDQYRILFSRWAQLEGVQLSASHFSFNHQLGACEACGGLGAQLRCNPEALISNPEQSLFDGAMTGHKQGRYYGDPHGQHLAILKQVAKEHQVPMDLPWNQLSDEAQQLALYGTGDRVYEVTWEFKNKTRSGVQELSVPWLGFCNYIDEEYERKQHNKNIQALVDLLHEEPCNSCGGHRLKPEPLQVVCAGLNIADLQQLSLTEAQDFFQQSTDSFSPAQQVVFETVKERVVDVLQCLIDLGVGYLQGDRRADSLSGGESQRLRLAAQLSAKLFGVTYLLDEPTQGLHEQNTEALLGVIHRLIQQGNTAVVVEHDETVIRAADHLIELGPGAGVEGGAIVAQGTLSDLLNHPESVTGKCLREPIQIEPLAHSLKPKAFGIRGAFRHNLQQIDIDFQAGGLIALTGVSGSGKSTLAQEVLLASARQQRPIGCTSTYGLDQFTRIVATDQQPLIGHALSTPATFLGLMDLLRKRFAATPEAKEAGLKASSFSYVHKDGKCQACNGYGQQKTALDFLGEVWAICDTCHGSRYQSGVLTVKWEGVSIAEVLQLSVKAASERFAHDKGLKPFLQAMLDTGIGHLKLGQAGNTLSGGESQRLKLAKELVDQQAGPTLYLFDEPSTGLHLADLPTLINLFNKLAAAGNTVLFVEHHPLLIAAANQVVELGPGGGPDGGCVLRS